MKCARISVGELGGFSSIALALILGGCAGSDPERAQQTSAETMPLERIPSVLVVRAEVVARGIPGAGAITEVGTFHRGGPIHDRPAFAALTAPGMMLDARRLLVASTSNFAAPLARATDAPGSVLSIDVDHGAVDVSADFAAAGGQAATADGRVRVYAAQNAAFLNGTNNPAAVTAALVSASLPLGISLNRGFGRPWIANAPNGGGGPGTITVVDPSGAPLAGAPSAAAGGVFAGNETNRSASSKGLDSGAIATALLTKSPDGSGRAVFLAAEADGSIVQVHVQKGVDALAPPGTFSPLTELGTAAAESLDPRRITRVGLAFNWVPTRIAYVTDPLANRIVALDLGDDGTLFTTGAPRSLRSRWFDLPVDLAASSIEVASDNFASNTTLGGGSDLYVVNRGNNSIVRVTQSGEVLAVRFVSAALAEFRLNGIAVSEDAQTIWVTAAAKGTGGVVMKLPAFGAGFVTRGMVAHARAAGAVGPAAMGADMFATELSPFQAVGPLFNARACGDCHNDPVQGGMGSVPDAFVERVGRLAPGSVFDPLIGRAGPVARAHSIAELGFRCGLPTGAPPQANVSSRRSAMTLRGTALIDFVQDRDILAAQAAQPEAVRGKVNRLADGRIGRFGWKAETATLVEFMGSAFTQEMGLTNPLAPEDEVHGCGADVLRPELDAVPLQAVTAFMRTLDPPVPDAAACLGAPGAAVFASTGCASCHTPSFPGPGRTINLYSDLLVHDMGAAFDDHVTAGQASGTEWRTMTLWRLSERTHFLHDGRAKSVVLAIEAHGGQAAAAVAAFGALDAVSRQALLDFLGCL